MERVRPNPKRRALNHGSVKSGRNGPAGTTNLKSWAEKDRSKKTGRKRKSPPRKTRRADDPAWLPFPVTSPFGWPPCPGRQVGVGVGPDSRCQSSLVDVEGGVKRSNRALMGWHQPLALRNGVAISVNPFGMSTTVPYGPNMSTLIWRLSSWAVLVGVLRKKNDIGNTISHSQACWHGRIMRRL